MIKKYEMSTGTFYLQEIPILDKPSPFNSISLTTKEVDFSDDRLLNIVEEDDYTIERYTENGIAKAIIKFQKDENGRGLIIMMDEEDMEKNGFKFN